MFTYHTPYVFYPRGKERSFEKGLSTTRFHKGFQRRMQSHIQQDAARLEREASKQHLSLRHLDKRRQRLGSLDKRNGFNLITGEFDAGNRRCTTPFHVKPMTVGIYVYTSYTFLPSSFSSSSFVGPLDLYLLRNNRPCVSCLSNNASDGPTDASHEPVVCVPSLIPQFPQLSSWGN